MRFWLTEKEVINLTKKTQPAAQLRALEFMRYHVVLRPDGSFVVPVDQFKNQEQANQSSIKKPDFRMIS